MLKTLAVEGSKWVNEENRVVNKIQLKPIAKVWVKLLKSRLMPTIHITTVSEERHILLYDIVKGFDIEIRKIIGKEIRECVMKKQKSSALFFPSLIEGICKVSKVKIIANNERVEYERALTLG